MWVWTLVKDSRIVTREHLHSLRSSPHADKLDVSEHFLQVVGAGAQGQMVENILTQLLDVRVHQLHLLSSLTPDRGKYLTKIKKIFRNLKKNLFIEKTYIFLEPARNE